MSNQEIDLPDWITSKNSLPQDYIYLYQNLRGPDGLICVNKVSNLLNSSGVRREFLGIIWATAKIKNPGILTEKEFYIVLALVALAQKGIPVYELSNLKNVPQAPIPKFPKLNFYNQDNLSRVGQSDFSNAKKINNHSFGNNTNSWVQQKVVFKPADDDEFSDFQSAISVSNENRNDNFHQATFDSPVHAIAKTNKASNNQSALCSNSAQQPSFSFSSSSPFLPIGNNSKPNNVGSRLANYDLGLTNSTTTTSTSNPSSISEVKTNNNFYSISNSNIFNNEKKQQQNFTSNSIGGDNLLIGEEDKYSALRNLVNNDLECEDNVIVDKKEKDGPQFSSVEHKISFVGEDVLQIIKTETNDSALDFGDFQSFTSPSVNIKNEDHQIVLTTTNNNTFQNNNNNNNFNNLSNFKSLTPQNEKNVPKSNEILLSSPTVSNFSILDQGQLINEKDVINSNNNDNTNSKYFSNNAIQNSVNSKSTTINGFSNSNKNNNDCDDAQFGDFVLSFSNGEPFNTTSTINSNTNTNKINNINHNNLEKISISSSKLYSGKKLDNKLKGKNIHNSSSSKINSNKIVKASNILTDSPTSSPNILITNNPENSSFSAPLSLDDYTLYSSNNNNNNSDNLQNKFSLDLLNISDFELSPASSNNSYNNFEPTTSFKEFGTTLKTTLIGSTSDTITPTFGEFKSSSQENPIDIDINNPINNLSLRDSPNFNENNFIKQSKQITPETQSVSSLDLGNYTNWDLVENQKSEAINYNLDLKSSPSSEILQPPSMNILPSPTYPLPSSTEDKYQCFKEEIENEKERYSSEWIRCLVRCLDVISEAVETFNSASSSGVIREVISCEKGHLYILNLTAIYQVASRINRSWLKLGGDSEIGELFRKISAIWDSLVPFLLGTPLMGQISSVDDWVEEEYTDFTKVCGVCLINSKSEDPSSLLDYGGKYYHASCANFWINKVELILPSLSYVS